MKISGTCNPGVTSNAATLTVNPAPAISTQPQAVTVCTGSNTNFSVSATGFNIGYQWQVNDGMGWSNISAPGANPAYSG